MAKANQAVAKTTATYVIPGDFCRIFAEDMNSLYRLAYLLTADGDQAEQCFSMALETCIGASGVFKEWARPWARRAVVESAIRMVKPSRERDENLTAQLVKLPGQSEATELLAGVLNLGTFERFVYVMSALEGMPDQDCKILLGSTRHDIVLARSEALAKMAASRPAEEVPETDASSCRSNETPFVVPMRRHEAVDVQGGLMGRVSA